MKKTFLLSFICIILALPVLSEYASASPNLTPKIKSTIKKLDLTSAGTLAIEWNDELRTPSRMTGLLTRPSNHSPQWIAYSFMHETRVLYGLTNPSRDLRITQINKARDGTIQVYMQRYLFGFSVLGDELTIEMNKHGVILEVNGTIHPSLEKKKFNSPTKPVISKEKALKTALDSFARKAPIYTHPTVELYYLPSRPGIPLVYIVKLRSSENDDTAKHILIHSVMGHIIN